MSSRTSHKSYQTELAQAFAIADKEQQADVLADIILDEISAIESKRKFAPETIALMHQNLSDELTFDAILQISEIYNLFSHQRISKTEVHQNAAKVHCAMRKTANEVAIKWGVAI
jgi:hypothetical protein